jgi:hypothetical protein
MLLVRPGDLLLEPGVIGRGAFGSVCIARSRRSDVTLTAKSFHDPNEFEKEVFCCYVFGHRVFFALADWNIFCIQ